MIDLILKLYEPTRVWYVSGWGFYTFGWKVELLLGGYGLKLHFDANNDGVEPPTLT